MLDVKVCGQEASVTIGNVKHLFTLADVSVGGDKKWNVRIDIILSKSETIRMFEQSHFGDNAYMTATKSFNKLLRQYELMRILPNNVRRQS